MIDVSNFVGSGPTLSILSPSASERGVSFRFLKKFIKEVPKDYTTADVTFKIIVPATSTLKSAFATTSITLDSIDVGRPNYFVSHRWGCKFWFIVELLQEFVNRNGLDENSAFFWIDIFAINQHPGQEQQDDLAELANVVSLSEKTLLCMDETGLVLTRIWCLYEIWKTLERKEGGASRLLILMSSLDCGDIFKKFHVSHAEATVPEDRMRILEDIEKSIGAQAMTLMVKQALLDSSIAEVTSWESASNIPQLVSSLINCTSLHNAAGKYATSEEKAMRALHIAAENYEKEHITIINCMRSLATAQHSQGKYAEAAVLHREALALRRKLLEPLSVEVAQSVNDLANVLSDQGKFDEAEGLYYEALELRRKLFGDEHPTVADTMNNLGVLLNDQGKYQEAETFHQQALLIRKKVLGPEHPDVADSLINLGNALCSQQKYEKVEVLDREALALRKKLFGLEHPEVALSMNNLADTLNSQGKFAEAEKMHREALEMRRKLLGNEHPSVTDSMNNLGNTLCYQERYQEAEVLSRLRKPMKIYET